MNHSTGATHRPRRAWPPTARTAAAVIAAASLALPVAAYGSSPASAVSRSTNTPKPLGYSRCMRTHGVPSFPDPTSSGVLPKISVQELKSPQFQAAEKACQHLLPAGTHDQYSPGEAQQLLIGMLRFSRCVRSHGVPNWPDPTTDAEGRPEFPLSNVPGTNRSYWRSQRITHVANECQHLLPPALGGNTPVG